MTKKARLMSRQQFLMKMHTHLSDSKAKLVREIAALFRTGMDTDRDDCLDTCDLGCDENEREMSTRLSERASLKIAQLDEALRRVAAGSYGLCEVCGLDVSESRLKAMPLTGLCCDCQQDRERESKSRRRREPEYENYQ
jgi:DnaK suppressor protein